MQIRPIIWTAILTLPLLAGCERRIENPHLPEEDGLLRRWVPGGHIVQKEDLGSNQLGIARIQISPDWFASTNAGKRFQSTNSAPPYEVLVNTNGAMTVVLPRERHAAWRPSRTNRLAMAWPGIEFGVLEEYSLEKNVQIEATYFLRAHDLEVGLLKRHRFDIAMVPGYIRLWEHERGHIMDIDRAKLNEFQHFEVASYFMNDTEPWEHLQGIPYSWDILGLVFNEELRLDSAPSLSLIFNGIENAKLAGRTSLVSSARKLLGTALLYLGYDPNESDTNRIHEAGKLLKERKAQLNEEFPYRDHPSYEMLLQRKLLLSMSWASTAAAYWHRDRADRDDGVQLRFLPPTEGTIMEVEYIVMYRDNETYALVDYLLEPEVSARVANGRFKASTSRAARRYIHRDVLQAIYGVLPRQMGSVHRQLGVDDATWDLFDRIAYELNPDSGKPSHGGMNDYDDNRKHPHREDADEKEAHPANETSNGKE